MVTNNKADNSRWVAEFNRRQIDRGLKRVRVWVPEPDVDRLKLLAKALRVEAGLTLPTDDEPRPPKLVLPDVRQHEPNPETTWLRLERHEVAYHKLLKANGGEWVRKLRRWHVRTDVVRRLGLGDRIAEPSDDDPEQETTEAADQVLGQRIIELEEKLAAAQKRAAVAPMLDPGIGELTRLTQLALRTHSETRTKTKLKEPRFSVRRSKHEFLKEVLEAMLTTLQNMAPSEKTTP